MALQEDKIDRYAILLDRGNEVFERVWNDIGDLKSRNATFASIILATLSINLTLLLFLYQTGWQPSCMDTLLLKIFVSSLFIALGITFFNLWPTNYLDLTVFEKKYLFSWDDVDVQGKDNKKLLKYLRDKKHLGYKKHLGDAKITKSKDDKVICIRKDENLVKITIDENRKKATLISSDRKPYELKVEKQNDVYYDASHILRGKPEKELFPHFLDQLQKNYNYNRDKYRKRMHLFFIAFGLFIVSIATFILLIVGNIVWR